MTYHDPCHLCRTLGVTVQPRQVIRTLLGFELRELQSPGACCGGRGSFAFTCRNLSRRIGLVKAEDIRQTRAEIVLTSCPSCRMQIETMLDEIGYPLPVLHPVECLTYGYGLVADGQQEALEPGAALGANDPQQMGQHASRDVLNGVDSGTPPQVRRGGR